MNTTDKISALKSMENELEKAYSIGFDDGRKFVLSKVTKAFEKMEGTTKDDLVFEFAKALKESEEPYAN